MQVFLITLHKRQALFGVECLTPFGDTVADMRVAYISTNERLKFTTLLLYPNRTDAFAVTADGTF